jgi:putative NADPH-quinone reductase
MLARRKILVLFAHPAYHRSHANLRLVEAVRDLPDITLHDLYEEYPDFNIDDGNRTPCWHTTSSSSSTPSIGIVPLLC